ncbi:S1 family peptidase [Roseibacillus persicicus]|uniref:Serine protease n=1 Tax=Roseibacillus persicicus TaxID=454148 RepID=A0A918TYI4_9BACT|nr:serine protease [Roseibacillus persicicus]GHC64689.1 hypothetical protein GCM10007100_35420 [Roseibacillus persicicus]
MKNLLLAACLLPGTLLARELPVIINDAGLIHNFEKKAGALAESGDFPRVESLKAELAKPKGMPPLPAVSAPEAPMDSVVMVGSVYDCGKCDRWHPGSLATAWVVGADGLFCTNYHVIETLHGETAAISTRKGEVYPVLEILLADKDHDVAIFRADITGLTPLPIAKDFAKVGADISCLSNPNQRFFYQSFGKVARYNTMRRKDRAMVPVMSITADFAKGSSGGPIINADNQVVGMVASTRSIYYENKTETGPTKLQMVMKSCVPGFVIEDLLTTSKSPEGVDENADEKPSRELDPVS